MKKEDVIHEDLKGFVILYVTSPRMAADKNPSAWSISTYQISVYEPRYFFEHIKYIPGLSVRVYLSEVNVKGAPIFLKKRMFKGILAGYRDTPYYRALMADESRKRKTKVRKQEEEEQKCQEILEKLPSSRRKFFQKALAQAEKQKRSYELRRGAAQPTSRKTK